MEETVVKVKNISTAEALKLMNEFLAKQDGVDEGQFKKFGVTWKAGGGAFYITISKKKFFSWMWLFVLVVKVIYQYRQFSKPFPDSNTLAFKFASFWFGVTVLFDRVIGRKVRPQPQDEDLSV